MKKFNGLFMVCLTALLLMGAWSVQAQVYVDQWGSIGGRTGGWIVSAADTGFATISGDSVPKGNWATVRGQFSSPATATESEAIIVKGEVEFVGSGPVTWSGLRYGLFRHDSVGTLSYAGTDSARWSGKENSAYGYMFTPQSGTSYTGNIPGGTLASQGITRGGSWISTYGGALGFGGLIPQRPARALFDEGKYDWAFSVQPLADGTNEVRFYMIKQYTGEKTSYWYGGTLIDDTGVTDTFNGICFGLDNNYDETDSPIRSMTLSNVTVELGDPIEVPEPPFEPFYVSEWGSMGGRTGGWRYVKDPFDVIGNAGIKGDAVPTGNWATLRGGFSVPVTATETNAVVVTGHVQFVGAGPTTWSGLRYGIFRHDSAGTVINAGTDSAQWNGKESDAYGYMFTPQSGTAYVGEIPGGTLATQGITRGGSWISTYGGALGFGGVIQQKPARALFDEGTYDFAFSIQPLGDGTNEVRFYMIKQYTGEQTSYYYAGTLIDTTGVTDTFNGVCFGLDNNYSETTSPIREMNLTDVYVTVGDPLDVPEPPWIDYYVDTWGFIGGRTGGWELTPDQVIGNTTISGANAPTGWSAVRGGFVESHQVKTDASLVVTGKMILTGGGFEDSGSLRFGIFNSDMAGSVDSTKDKGLVWTGSEDHHSGYLFIAQEGSNGPIFWPELGENGTWGAIADNIWFSTNGKVLGSQIPSPSAGGAGTYMFEIAVQALENGSNAVKVTLSKDGYSWMVQGIDNQEPFTSDKFNCVAFAIKNGTTTSLRLEDVNVDYKGDIVSIDDKPNTLLPTVYSLRQNYPNPFNPSTTIEFALPKAGKVDLTVYDITGRVVANLVEGNFNAGYHKVTFDASHLASGLYFYKLKADEFVSVKKLMFLK